MKKSILRECLRIARVKNTPDNHPEHFNFPHFAFIIQRNRLLEWATNKPGASWFKWGYPSTNKVHAEADAYRKARGLLASPTDSFECVNIRLNKQNDLRLSAPCKCCYNFLQQFGCKKIWFSTESGFASICL